jgi:hypothetical protein
MEKQEKRETKGCRPEDAGRERMVRRPITAQERAQIMKSRPKWSCRDCVFCISSRWLWTRTLMSGFPVTGMCANHPDTPGQMRPVPHGGVCRNFRAKVQPPVRVEPPTPPNPKVPLHHLDMGLASDGGRRRLRLAQPTQVVREPP